MITTATILFHSKTKKEVNLFAENPGNDITVLFSGKKVRESSESNPAEYLKYLAAHKLKLCKAVFHYETNRRELRTQHLAEKQIYIDDFCCVGPPQQLIAVPINHHFTMYQNVADQIEIPMVEDGNFKPMETNTLFLITPNINEYGKITLFFTDNDLEKVFPGIPDTIINVVEKSGTGTCFISNPGSTSKPDPNA